MVPYNEPWKREEKQVTMRDGDDQVMVTGEESLLTSEVDRGPQREQLIIWNCRGAASNKSIAAVKEINRLHKPDLFALVETRVSGNKVKDIVKRMGFNFSVRVEARGYTGGIWLCWKEENLSVEVLWECEEFSHVRIDRSNSLVCFCTIVYANPQGVRRNELWDKWNVIAQEEKGPWLIGGDFNDIASLSEQSGGMGANINRCNAFRDWIHRNVLIDLDPVGPFFTWRGPKWEGRERVFKRLDRGLCNVEWQNAYSNAFVRVLPRIHSDHHPLLFNFSGQQTVWVERPFRFEAMWLKHPDFKNFMEKKWNKGEEMVKALESLKEALRVWNKEVFGDLRKRKNKLLARIGGIQQSLGKSRNPFLDELSQELQQELMELLLQEEIFWFQKSWGEWMENGDRNTHYYHLKTLNRRRRNRIVMLKDEYGMWIDNEIELIEMVRNYFINMLQRK
ncbi:uncharacterized protein LOC114726829 [Neltuma alba]|uniref:uncharacterized protein LOC114726829 n=1 Tax=Neltuma alba TaxID=207710 RepID=UPI0010A505E2|nr:uncharacterized protein LOC114726829 [Prosopis alba]